MTNSNPALILTLLLYLMVSSTHTAERSCEKIDECSCKFKDTGGVVDLKTLGFKDGTPAFANVKGEDDKLYSYNPCFPFTEKQCTDSAICQLQPGLNGTAVSLASQKNNLIAFDGHDVRIIYLGQIGSTKVSTVTLTCDQDMAKPSFVATGKNGTGETYYFHLRSKCACENGCIPQPKPAESGGGMSAGSVLLILFFVFIAVYLIVGVFHGKVARGAKGPEVLPNYEFWSAVPGLIQDGCAFTSSCSCFQRRKTTYEEV